MSMKEHYAKAIELTEAGWGPCDENQIAHRSTCETKQVPPEVYWFMNAFLWGIGHHYSEYRKKGKKLVAVDSDT